jgi:arylsulfatase A-like enzyme
MYARCPSGPWLLYDLQQDPYELHNLVNDAAHAADLQELDKQLLDLMAHVGDSWSLDWTAPVEDDERLDRYRAFYTV